MRIIIQDDTYRDVINWKSLPKSFLPNTVEVAKDAAHSESKAFLLMVEPDDSIAAVKAYIQEEKGISFKKQKLLNEDGGVMRDALTLLSAGIKKGSTLILRYAPITQIIVTTLTGRRFKLMVESDDTVADVKVAIQEKEGIRFHKQRIIYNGRQLEDHVLLVDCGIQYNSVLSVVVTLCDKGEDLNMYTIKLYYKGWWVFEPEMNYVSGQIAYYDYCNSDENSIIQMRQCMKSGKEVKIFVEHTDEDQWSYDVIDYEGDPILHGEEGLVDVAVIEKDDESDATSEEYESFHDSDYYLEEDDILFDKNIDSTVEWVGVNRISRENQVKEKIMEFGVALNIVDLCPTDQLCFIK
ncbi:hypothetical protein BC332_33151 [Capsicum chinense]|nr:hypothetical protein BC332_33151 [Capsicum chinense]